MKTIKKILRETAKENIDLYIHDFPQEYKWEIMFDKYGELNEDLAIEYILDVYGKDIVDLIMDDLDGLHEFTANQYDYYKSNLEYIAEHLEVL